MTQQNLQQLFCGDAESTISPDGQLSDTKQFSFQPTFVICSSGGEWTWSDNNTLLYSVTILCIVVFFILGDKQLCLFWWEKKCMLIVIHVWKAEKSILLGRKETFLTL